MRSLRISTLFFVALAALAACKDGGGDPTRDGGYDAGQDAGPVDPCIGTDENGLGDPITTCNVSSSECALSTDAAYLNQCAGFGVECDAFDGTRIPAVP